MVGVALLVLSIAALDSLNPSTIAPAFVLASGRSPTRAVAFFAAGVFAVSTCGGLLLLFVGAHSVLPALEHPSPRARHVGTFAVGIGLLALALVLWIWRERIWRRASGTAGSRRAPALLGAAIMAVELPTALPYFGAILAIAEVRGGVTADTALLLLYNVVFVAPLIVLIALARTASERGPRLVERFRELLLRHAPRVVPAGMGVIGAILIAIGAAET